MTTVHNDTLPVLLVDDEPAWLRSFSLLLRGAGITDLITCGRGDEVLPILRSGNIAAVVLDLVMPGPGGEVVLQQIVEEFPGLPVVVLTGLDLVETAVSCMRRGAFDYYTKVAEEERLVSGVRRAMEFGRLHRLNLSLKERLLEGRLRHPDAFGAIVTGNKKMQGLFHYAEAIAPTAEPLLITGETGTGKELFARAVHRLSGRNGAFVAVNISGLDDQMLADALFGHQRGAFTGADQPRRGLVKEAAAGTLFLDEIGDLSPAAQVKLLRLLQEREYYPLGSDRPETTDARLIFATHQNLERLMEQGAFRRDLYFRLRTHLMHIPPLRERREDIPLLVEHFVARTATTAKKENAVRISQKTIEFLSAQPFPGNVREIEAMIQDGVTHVSNGTLLPEHFKAHFPQIPFDDDREASSGRASAHSMFTAMDSLPTLKTVQSFLVEEALRRTGGNVAAAAAMIGVSRQALHQRLKNT